MKSAEERTPFEAYLDQHDDAGWHEVLDRLEADIHEVDRDATRIWFHFFPVDLARAFAEADDPEALAEELLIQGDPHLVDQIDTSHTFVYGHRWWPQVKDAVIAAARSERAPDSLDLADVARQIAADVAAQQDVERSLLVGITAIGLMTLQQVGLGALDEAAGQVHLPHEVARRSPDQVIERRNREGALGLFSFLKGVRKEYRVTFSETEPETYWFKLVNSQYVTQAAKDGARDYPSMDPRCKQDEGPIPVQCRSAACGTCWVGVLGGSDNLTEVERLERTRIRYFGYIDSDEPRPPIRLSCQARSFGNAAIVLPPWNGQVGELLRQRRDAEERTSSVSE